MIRWPDKIPLLYYAYHIMVGLGTIFIALLGAGGLQAWRGWLYDIEAGALGADAARRFPISPRPPAGSPRRSAGSHGSYMG